MKPKQTNDPFPEILKILSTIYDNRKKRLGNEENTERQKGVCGIIYCSTRAQCEKVSQQLIEHDIMAHSYHAGLSTKQRENVLNSWIETTSDQNSNKDRKSVV